MTLEEAKAIRKRMDDERYEYYDLTAELPEDRACLDGHFTADELEALSVIMRAAFKAAGDT